MKFMKYPSITNHYDTRSVQQVGEQGFAKMTWYAVEKIHGANFAVYKSGDDIRFAKRTSFIEPDEKFFGWERLEGELHSLISEVYVEFPCKTLIIFGELFGPGVQKGIDYGDKLSFRPFDVVCDGKFLDYRSLIQSHSVGLHLPPLAGVGSFEEMLLLNNHFDSHVTGIAKEGNTCEGLVIRPNQTAFFARGGRVMFKSKNERFKEVHDGKKGPSHKKTFDATKDFFLFKDHLTPQRVASVVSKIGEVTMKDFGLVMNALFDDAIEESGIMLAGDEAKHARVEAAKAVKFYFTSGQY